VASEEEFVRAVRAKFGPTLDLENRPQDLIDILRSARLEIDDPDGGLLPGGAPPPPPPTPTSFQVESVRLEEVMRVMLDMSRQLDKNRKDVKAIKEHLGL
jgi:hypothetical protein